MMIRFTKSQLMAANEASGLTKEAAYNLIVFLRAEGVIVEDGSDKHPEKRGKGETFYKGELNDIKDKLASVVFPGNAAR